MKKAAFLSFTLFIGLNFEHANAFMRTGWNEGLCGNNINVSRSQNHTGNRDTNYITLEFANKLYTGSFIKSSVITEGKSSFNFTEYKIARSNKIETIRVGTIVTGKHNSTALNVVQILDKQNEIVDEVACNVL